MKQQFEKVKEQIRWEVLITLAILGLAGCALLGISLNPSSDQLTMVLVSIVCAGLILKEVIDLIRHARRYSQVNKLSKMTPQELQAMIEKQNKSKEGGQ